MAQSTQFYWKQSLIVSQLLLGYDAINDYANDGGPEVVWHLCSFYQGPLLS